MAGTRRAPERRRSFLIDLPEEILSEILLLLPPKYILRCGAVCKALCNVASDHAFLLAHHRRQPPRRLFSFVRDVGDYPDDLGLVDYCVEAVDLRIHDFRSIVRFTAGDYDCLEGNSPFAIHAACDGLLLMSFKRLLYLCNPTTRQWVSILRPALRHNTVMGLYAHGSSSEYRVLYCRHNHGKPLFFISTVGSEIERGIPLRSARAQGAKRATAAAMAESSRAAVRHAGLEIPEDLMADILARMPATSILRFRAACKCWHHRTKDPAFLLTHHLCQPAQPLFCSRLNVKDQDAFRMGHYCCLELEAVDLPPRMVVRFKGIESIQFNLLAVHGSCDGLLLLSNLDAHFVCNPATRQWARLPRLPPPHACRIAGFYAHAASGKYRGSLPTQRP
ncbi:hypothetical protein PR202_ga26006 [Eleusine coracana subsp. coracana]|uniref:F-box domain-containing protein n=1 Tax=Eleusine coracana subsp. coracana TaxID=191504 RepID=A0AAV5DD53_ELECO|nr:hypothetical protein PR202_ga26006 [Eleusine coracana subsp. coracana]